ncbi:TPA: hypothetical protein RQ911_002014 [Pseudomonas aeruginosa]|uniref:Uncharacterized protein n=1 Tax=Pseudomonas aeruginosa TaxID=287 RepID=A0A6A9K1A7_PSEAI|nr:MULTISPECIES: putative phage tail assembly chaperone [Pseudomonas]AWQ84162.1 hypothetical protein CSC33_3243 [Pseudomonas aeruginosa]EJB8382821.1 hypothetical protein [Pseudomonas aeruginosa]KRU94460.1 hypothetical protein AN455_16575 [Pseudomonas aeruginosa]KRV12114.1 hypothetical protein AN456_09860 [Pseudomonas aeruginosa]KSJ17950.1 hypothetical protein AO994_00500 [Pseudomonas aeruginosa]
MNQEHRLTLDQVTYLMRPANALPAWNALKKAARLLQGLELGEGSESAALGAILGNLGDPVVAEVEQLVLQHINVQPQDGQAFRLVDRLDTHFNQHRAHLLPLLIEGVKYQFADFFGAAMPALAKVLPVQAQA